MTLKCTPGTPCAHAVDISILEQKIARLEAQLRAEKREQLHRRHLHNTKHDPLCRIPTEIASAILCYANPLPSEYFYLDGDPQFYLLPGVAAPTRPIEFASVSRRWRDVAFSEPHLWTQLVMRRSSSTWDLSQDLVLEWLARSGALPLVIVLSWTPTSDAQIIVIEAPQAVLPFFRCGAEITQDLRYLMLDLSSGSDTRFDFGQTVIRPRSFTSMALLTAPASINWTNVTRLQMYNIAPDALLSILPTCVLLEEMNVSLAAINNAHETPPTTLHLVLLCSLDVYSVKKQDGGHFLNEDEELAPAQLFLLRPLLLQSENVLTTLNLGIPLAENQLLELLTDLPYLECLALTYHNHPSAARSRLDGLFDQLTVNFASVGPASLLPNLKNFEYTGPKSFRWNKVADFLEAHFPWDPAIAWIPKKRCLYRFYVEILPSPLVEDYIDKETLTRFFQLPAGHMFIVLTKTC